MPGSKSFMIFMYGFQKLWLKTFTRDDIWAGKLNLKKLEKRNLNYSDT